MKLSQTIILTLKIHISIVTMMLIGNCCHAEDRYRSDIRCIETRQDSEGEEIIDHGQKIVTPFGSACWLTAWTRQDIETPNSANLFVAMGNSIDNNVSDLQKQIETLRAENTKLRTENAQWQKDALKDTLDRLNAMPQTFAAQESVQKTLVPLLTPLVIQEIIKDPLLLKQIRGN
jgi:hypothetical protein